MKKMVPENLSHGNTAAAVACSRHENAYPQKSERKAHRCQLTEPPAVSGLSDSEAAC